MNRHRDDCFPSCCIHPDVAFVGVCPLCLHERLVVLAAKQRSHRRSISGRSVAHQHSSKKGPISIPGIFSIGSLLNRLEFRHRGPVSLGDARDASSSPEDESFISIKFEDNGIPSWEKSNGASKVPLDNCNNNISWNHRNSVSNGPHLRMVTSTKSALIEQPKPQVAPLRWRKRIGHLLHLIRWRRSSKAGSASSGGAKVEGVKVRNGWMRSLTKKSTRD